MNFLAWRHFPGDRQWRLPIGLQRTPPSHADVSDAAVIPGTMLLIGAILMPESPRWLMSKKRKDEAREIVARIWAADEKDQHVKSQVKGMAKVRAHGRRRLTRTGGGESAGLSLEHAVRGGPGSQPLPHLARPRLSDLATIGRHQSAHLVRS